MGKLVISPDATVRFLRDHAVLHNAHRRSAPLRTSSAGVFEVLLSFLAPQDPSPVRESVPQDQRDRVDELIQALRLAGVLIDAVPPPAAGPASGRVELIQRQLGLLANATAEIAADLAAIGAAPLPEDSRTDGLRLEHRLAALLSAVDGIRQEIAEARAILLNQQLERIRNAGLLQDLKLHVGSGTGRLQGWVNIDLYPADLSINVNRPLPFADSSARLVFASHILEHLYYPGAALRFLAECRRVLAPGGRLRLVVPDIEKYIKAYAEQDDAFFAARRRTWQGLPEGRTRLEEFLSYAGAGPEPAAFLESHKYGYDFDTLSKALRLAGFVRVERSSFDGSQLPELRVDSVSEVAHAAVEGRHYSLFVEGVAP